MGKNPEVHDAHGSAQQPTTRKKTAVLEKATADRPAGTVRTLEQTPAERPTETVRTAEEIPPPVSQSAAPPKKAGSRPKMAAQQSKATVADAAQQSAADAASVKKSPRSAAVATEPRIPGLRKKTPPAPAEQNTAPARRRRTAARAPQDAAAAPTRTSRRSVNKAVVHTATPTAPPTSPPPTVPPISPEERLRMIRDAAYYRAEKRGFAPGHEYEDWLAAEREIDEWLRQRNSS